jgi:hypothetical protein
VLQHVAAAVGAAATAAATHCCFEPEEACQYDLMVWHDLLHCHQQSCQNAMEATKLGIPTAAAAAHNMQQVKQLQAWCEQVQQQPNNRHRSANTALEIETARIRPAAVR